jgi:hypothetical protein
VVEKIVQVPIYVYVDRPVYVPVQQQPAPCQPRVCGGAAIQQGCGPCSQRYEDSYYEESRERSSYDYSDSRYSAGGGWNAGSRGSAAWGGYIEPPPLPMGYVGAQSGGRGGGYGGPGLVGGGGYAGGYAGGYSGGYASSSASAHASASASSSVRIGGGYHGGGGGGGGCSACGGGKHH